MNLPYFDGLLESIDQGNRDVEKAFGLNVHWGYWDDPSRADGSLEDFAAASHRMTRKVYSAARIRDGMRILDVGCGFGGTIHELDRNFMNVDLHGLNIDPRQLARAREVVRPREGNRVSFVEGDACALPFEDGSFDAVLAVECIFHFPSRARFFAEAHRVLKKDGRLAVSDALVSLPTLPLLVLSSLPYLPALLRTYGKNDVTSWPAYRYLARRAGFSEQEREDITANVLPTYDVLKKGSYFTRAGSKDAESERKANEFLEASSRRRFALYCVMGFGK